MPDDRARGHDCLGRSPRRPPGGPTSAGSTAPRTLSAHDGSALRVPPARRRPRSDCSAGTAGHTGRRRAAAVVEPPSGRASHDRAAAQRHRVHRATSATMTAIITRATVVGGHDGRAEIEVELTYDNGGTATISLDEEACTASLDQAGVSSLDELVGRSWSIVLPALARQRPGLERPELQRPELQRPGLQRQGSGETHARSRHP